MNNRTKQFLTSLWPAKRKFANIMLWSGTILATVLAVLPLALVIIYLFAQGAPSLNLALFTQLPKPEGEVGGGMGNAMLGTLILIGIGSVIGIPVGLFGGICLAEYGNNRFGAVIRFAADVLASVPSIVIGILVYTILVLGFEIKTGLTHVHTWHIFSWMIKIGPVIHLKIGYSALAGGVALGVMMIPMVMRTSEEIIRMVPRAQREAALALGATQFTTIFRIVMLSAKGGVITGVLLAVARIAGETAPLLFTTFGNPDWSTRLDKPIASLPKQIYEYATGPYNDQHAQAWAGALVLVLIILIISVAARYATRGRIHIAR